MPTFSFKPFAEALQRLQGQSLLPTSGGTYDLSQLPADVRERAFFSARVVNADILQQAYDLISRGVGGGSRDDAGNYVPGSSVNLATFRLEMKDYLKSISYQPEAGEEGTLKDLTSDKRLQVIYKTNVEMAQGYGAYIQQQNPDSLDAYPAQELYRLEDRKERRPWGQRWNDAIRELGMDNTSAMPVADSYADEGMFALVNDPIWITISRFGLPYPPFDFGSGMWVRDISRLEAQEMGLLAPGDPAPDPDIKGFNDGMQALVIDLAPVLQDALSAFGRIVDGVFHISNRGTSEGAIKGWETRRGIGEIGDHKSLGLPLAIHLVPDAPLPKSDPQKARQRLEEGFKAKDVFGNDVSFHRGILDHWHLDSSGRPKTDADISGRLASLDQGVQSIKTPHEVWERNTTRTYIQAYGDNEKKRILSGFVAKDGKVESYFSTIKGKKADKMRKGKLLYVRP